MQSHPENDELEPTGAGSLRLERCPAAGNGPGQWWVFRHENLLRVLHEHDTFSNAVSQHRSVPNGMDPPEHDAYRRLIEPYLAPAVVDGFEPACRNLVRNLLGDIPPQGDVELISAFALPFAAGVQCAYLGWSAELAARLIDWTQRNQQATRLQDRPQLREIADEFQTLVDELLAERADAHPAADLTTALLHEHVHGRRLQSDEIASILRNWTVGEVGTIAASVGILAHFLARHPDVQTLVRSRPDLLDSAIDEILRIDGPLPSGRRVTTRPVQIGGRRLEAGSKLTLLWAAANRDGRVFEQPERFRLDRDPAANLLYGSGIHVCPGARLARLELRVAVEELFAHTRWIDPLAEQPPPRARFPAGGYQSMPLRFR